MRFQSLDLNMGDNYVDKHRLLVQFVGGAMADLNYVDKHRGCL